MNLEWIELWSGFYEPEAEPARQKNEMKRSLSSGRHASGVNAEQYGEPVTRRAKIQELVWTTTLSTQALE
ncbi:hypothetical protein CQ018_15025 [Arthrobacter sp. MYb227]|nr:hypothetical protein CQ018_15025 [Arthrobacter sp. MYb227]